MDTYFGGVDGCWYTPSSTANLMFFFNWVSPARVTYLFSELGCRLHTVVDSYHRKLSDHSLGLKQMSSLPNLESLFIT